MTPSGPAALPMLEPLPRRPMRLAAGLLALAALCLAPPAQAQGAHVPSGPMAAADPVPDAFYDPPPDPPREPGILLRSAPLGRDGLPAGLRGWRILYTTSIDDETPAVASGTVFASADPHAAPRPVIGWGHGTTGLMRRCMPSLATAPARGIPALSRLAAAGWAVVSTDYPFLERDGTHPFLIGEAQARATLDAIRAARQLPEPRLGRRSVIWGHSQGGHTALWAGIVAPDYAPEVELLGIAAIAPPADLAHLLALNPALDKRLGPYLALSYSRFYRDVAFDRALLPAALPAGRAIARLCAFAPIEDRRRVRALMASFDGRSLATASNPALAARLAENSAHRPIGAPLVVIQGRSDVVVVAPATDAFVAARCAAGQRLEYWTFNWTDHGGILQPGGPLERPLLEWTEARLAGEAQADGCTRRSF